MKTASLILTSLLVLMLLASAFLGITDGVGLVRQAHTTAQAVATAAELLYGVAAVGALVALASRHKFAPHLLTLWAACVTITSGLAPVVWGGTSVAVGAESGVAAGRRRFPSVVRASCPHHRGFSGPARPPQE